MNVRRSVGISFAIGLVAMLVVPARAGTTVALTGFNLTGDGASWNVNNDAASSGFGASPCVADPHSYSPAVDASAGAQPDAFDGGLMEVVAGTTFKDPDGNGTQSGQILNVGPKKIAGLKVFQTDAALSTSPTLRLLLGFTNPSRAAISASVVVDSKLGDGTSEGIDASSTGDSSFGIGDRWVITHDTGGSDPAVTEAFFGKGAGTKVAKIVKRPAVDGCITVRYRVKIPARSTRYLLAFAQVHVMTSDAETDAAAFDSVTSSSSLVAGIGSHVRAKILNWKL